MRILFLHGWTSVPGGRKPTYFKDHGYTVFNPSLPDDDFDEAVRIAQAEYDAGQPNVIVGSSRGGAVAVNMQSGDTPLVLLCPAWKKWGTATITKMNTTILHSREDDVIPFEDSEELAENSELRDEALIEVGSDHRLADPEPLEAMLRATIESCIPEGTDDPNVMLLQNWGGLCYTAALRWVGASANADWVLVHGEIGDEKVSRRVKHAWCEHDDRVVDLTMPDAMRIFERAEYYRIFRPDVDRTYSSEDATLLMLRTGHDGPWDESEQLS